MKIEQLKELYQMHKIYNKHDKVLCNCGRLEFSLNIEDQIERFLRQNSQDEDISNLFKYFIEINNITSHKLDLVFFKLIKNNILTLEELEKILKVINAKITLFDTDSIKNDKIDLIYKNRTKFKNYDKLIEICWDNFSYKDEYLKKHKVTNIGILVGTDKLYNTKYYASKINFFYTLKTIDEKIINQLYFILKNKYKIKFKYFSLKTDFKILKELIKLGYFALPFSIYKTETIQLFCHIYNIDPLEINKFDKLKTLEDKEFIKKLEIKETEINKLMTFVYKDKVYEITSFPKEYE